MTYLDLGTANGPHNAESDCEMNPGASAFLTDKTEGQLSLLFYRSDILNPR